MVNTSKCVGTVGVEKSTPTYPERLKISQYVTVVMVNYSGYSEDNTNLLLACLKSVRHFYPNIRIIVVDGTPSECEFFNSVKDVVSKFNNVTFIPCGYNIGHGRGMNIGITLAETPYVLICDTDVTIDYKNSIEDMLALAKDNTLAIGQIIPVPKQSYGLSCGGDNILIVAPYFHIINKKEYVRYLPYIHNGGPTCLTMADVFSRGLEKEVLIDFPVRKYVAHPGGGSRGTLGEVIIVSEWKPKDFFDVV